MDDGVAPIPRTQIDNAKHGLRVRCHNICTGSANGPFVHIGRPKAPDLVLVSHRTTDTHCRYRRHRGAAGIDGQLATKRERTSARPLARRWRPTDETDDVAGTADVWRGGDQVPGVGMRRAGEDVLRRTDLHDPPGIHHRHGISQVGHDRKIMRDVEGGHVVQTGERPHGCEHVGLSGDVEAGGGLIEHDHCRPTGERHGERHPLLLTTRQLVRVTQQKLRVRREEHLLHHLDDSGLAGLRRAAEVVNFQYLHQLNADAQCRVERRRRVLWHVSHAATSHGPQCFRVQGENLGFAAQHLAARNPNAAPRVAEHGKADRGLARPRFPHQPKHRAGRHGEVHFIDDVVTADRHLKT